MEPFNKRIRNRMMPLILLIVAITACTPLAEETAPEGNAAPLANITIDTRNGGEEDFTILDYSLVDLYVQDDTGNEKRARYTYTDGNWVTESYSDVITCATGNYPAYAYGLINVTYPNSTYPDALYVTWVGRLATTATTGVATAAPLTMQIATTRIKITVTGAYGETAADKLPDFEVEAALKYANDFDRLPDDPYTEHRKLIPLDYNATWFLNPNNGYSWGSLVPNTVLAGEELFTLTAQDGYNPKYDGNTYKVTAPNDITFQAGHEYHYTIALTGGGEARITHQEITPFTPGRITEADGRTPGIYDEKDLRDFATDWNTDPTTALTKWQDAPGSGIIRLMNNIDMTSESFTPIGTSSNPFDNATFHGGGHTITGLTVNTSEVVGLFGYIGTKGTVCHLHLREATITTTDYFAGGIAGENSGTLLACSVQGNITTIGYYAGGITGSNTGTLLACTFAGSLKTGDAAGGITGANNGTITACYSQAYDFKTTPTQYGIAYNHSSAATITACHWLTGTDLPTTAGGSGGTTTACAPFVIEAEFQTNANYTRLMNNALATIPPLQGGGAGQAGGGGWNQDYSWLHLAGAMPVVINTPPVAIYKSIATEADLRQFTADWAANPTKAILSWAGADGVIRLAADITLSDAPFPPIGTQSPWNPFTAVFDGQGHTLTGLHIDDDSENYTGLFGVIASTGVVRNLHLRGAIIKGKNYVGGIAGRNVGILAACSFGGTVKATGIYAGGIAGRNEVAATGTYGVYGCYSIATSVTVGSGTAYGIAAYNASTIHGCPWLVDAGQPATAGNNAGGTITACNSFTGVDAFNTGTYVEDMNAALDACGKATMKWSAVPGHYPKLEVQ